MRRLGDGCHAARHAAVTGAGVYAIRLANASEHGLASYVYSRDFNRLLRVAEQIEFGMVGLNAGVISNAAAPFGGVKQSGREGGSEGIAEYTTTQYIGLADPYAS